MIDIVFDLETCAKGPNAAVLQIAAVACNFCKQSTNPSEASADATAPDASASGSAEPWLRDPYGVIETINFGIDLNEQFLAGADFDPSTQKWWMSDSKAEARRITLSVNRCSVHDAMLNFSEWIAALKEQYQGEPVCIWAQGSDFDIPKLYHLYDMAGIPEHLRGFKYNQVRCARTYCLETLAAMTGNRLDALLEVNGHHINDLYSQIPPFQMPEGMNGTVHDALYDSMRSAYNVWWLMNNHN